MGSSVLRSAAGFVAAPASVALGKTRIFPRVLALQATSCRIERMFERSNALRDDDYGSSCPPDFDIDLLLATDPNARTYTEERETDLSDAAELARLEASWADWTRRNPDCPERIWTEQDRPLCDRDPDTFTDSEALRRLVEVETSIAHAQALRARLVALVAAQRQACDDRPSSRPSGQLTAVRLRLSAGGRLVGTSTTALTMMSELPRLGRSAGGLRPPRCPPER